MSIVVHKQECVQFRHMSGDLFAESNMDFTSEGGLQILFRGTFGQKWRNSFGNHGNEKLDTSNYIVHNVEGGYLNRVYRLCSKNDQSQSVFIKHAPPFIKCLGYDQPLGEERLHTEFLALRKFQQAVPGSVPDVYFHDEETKCVVMEDLRNYEVMGSQLSQGCLDIVLVRRLASVVAKLHRNTHVATTSSSEFTTMLETFRNEEMVALNADMTFDLSNPANRCSPELEGPACSIRKDPEIVANIQSLHLVFLQRKECLTHGDLHLGSVMVNESSVKLIDAEFAFMGPAASDVGHILSNFIFSYAAHTLYPKEENSSIDHLLREATQETVDVYFDEAKEFLSEDALATLVSQTAGFTGCHIIKWIIGIAEARDLLDKPQAELMCLSIGARLVKEYNMIRSTQDLLRCIFDT
ncbi:methylthioribose kinase-like isoform X2 [Patiria miniata]|uniref:Aminoglycoside phosphotransferase domain-containing protein n=1 Tax=Patiria miniata TaxID=46514 RepID=A0A914A865_PATMI|nr:methylthioribose kinase-like isoform X2 [Patiria miniata]